MSAGRNCTFEEETLTKIQDKMLWVIGNYTDYDGSFFVGSYHEEIIRLMLKQTDGLTINSIRLILPYIRKIISESVQQQPDLDRLKVLMGMLSSIMQYF